MNTVNQLLAENSAEVSEGFEQWFATVVRRSKRHRQHLREYRQSLAQFGLGRRLVAVMSLFTIAFDPTDPVARRPRHGSGRSIKERQADSVWVGHYQLPGVSN